MVEAEEAQTSSSIGERLKAARKAKKLSLEAIAAETRVPMRHLQNIENDDWDALPAPTYSVGFARSYANAVGLDGAALGGELREHLNRQSRGPTPAYYEPADPARVPPRSLAVIAGVIAVLLAVGYMVWRSMAVGDAPVDQIAGVETELPAAQPAHPNAPPVTANRPLAGPPATANAPVTLTATDNVWLRVYEGDTDKVLFENILKPGEHYQVPSNAVKPEIRTGKPEALQVTVGQTRVPPLGAPATTVSDVSLAPADLLGRAGAVNPAAAPTPAPSAARP